MPSISSDPAAVSVGFSTKLGASLTATGVATAIVAFIAGDRSEQTLGVISGAAVAALAFAITAAGRYAQARTQIKAAPEMLTATSRAKVVDRAQVPPTPAQYAAEYADAGWTVTTDRSPATDYPTSTPADVEAQQAHDAVVADHGIDDDPPDPFDGLPDIVPESPDTVGEDLGDPLTRGEVDGVTDEVEA
jgi:hypothetical protein